MINLLVRNGYRPDLFRRCLVSIETQTYKNVHVIVANDSDESEADCIKAIREFPKSSITPLKVLRKKGSPFHWNLYCNDLKSSVTNGWFMYLDNDDYLNDKFSLEVISKHLTNPDEAVICQFLRNGKAKPTIQFWGHIVIGKIGGSCIIIHHSKKNVANWDGNRAADFRFIRDVAKKLPLKWVEHVVVRAGNSGLKGRL